MTTSIRIKMFKWILFAGSLAFVFVSGCSKSSSPTSSNNDLTEAQTLALGWQNFEAGRYDAAVTNFTTVNNQSSSAGLRGEALCGRGWSYLNQRNLAWAKSDFAIASGLAGVSSGVLDDVRVGLAFTLFSLNDFSGASTSAAAALSDNPVYSFSHQVKVTTKRVRLLLAQCYFGSGQFSKAAAQLDIADPALAPHSADPSVLLQSITFLLNSL